MHGIAEEKRAKRVRLMLEADEGLVAVEEEKKATRDRPAPSGPECRAARTATSELASPGVNRTPSHVTSQHTFQRRT